MTVIHIGRIHRHNYMAGSNMDNSRKFSIRQKGKFIFRILLCQRKNHRNNCQYISNLRMPDYQYPFHPEKAWFPIWHYPFPSHFQTMPANKAPTTGATINSQSCSMAQPPTKMAWLMLRAGLTEVLVTGMETK